MDVVAEVYELTKQFPREETYGLTSQLRRAAVSVPSNIAEGACDRSTDQFRHFLAISIGSLNEIDTQLQLAKRLGYADAANWLRLEELVDECLAVTYGLRRSLSR
jgi:four helix bundle protein